MIVSLNVAAILAAMHLRVFASSLEALRIFHQLASIAWLHWPGLGVASDEGKQSVIEVARDGKVGIDLKFGSITFKEEEGRSYAVALVDVIVNDLEGHGTRVQMEVKVPADPESDSILGVTEKCRTHIVATLRGAADTFDSTTARALLFHGER